LQVGAGYDTAFPHSKAIGQFFFRVCGLTALIPDRLHDLGRPIAGLILCAAIIAASAAVAQEDETPFPAPRPEALDDSEASSTPDREPAPSNSEPESASEAAEAVAAPPQQVTLTARITEDGAQIPDGLIWRVFGTETNAQGEIEMVARSEQAVANLTLPPGEYVVHAAYGRSQVSDTLLVERQSASKTFILDAGALRMQSEIVGDYDIPLSELAFDIYSAGLEEDRVAVETGMPADTMIHLNAGVYNVVSRWGDLNATVRADLRVEPGQVTDATLYHRASRINWTLVSTEGGEAILGVEWRVEDMSGNEVYSETGAFPTAVLAEGDYVVIAQQGEDVYNREFQVTPGPARDIEILTEVYEAGVDDSDDATASE